MATPTPEQHKIIMEVVKKMAGRYKFGYYDKNDMEQEAYIMCMDALDRWDGKRPLKNFLYSHLSNRLKSFKRDRYHRPHITTDRHKELNERKRRLVDVLPLDVEYPLYYETDILDKLEKDELFSLVMEKLTPVERELLYDVMHGNATQSVKEKIMKRLQEIKNEIERRETR